MAAHLQGRGARADETRAAAARRALYPAAGDIDAIQGKGNRELA